jgi:hypothetical protein
LGARWRCLQAGKFRAAALDKELVLLAKSGSAATIQDDKENIYDLTVAGQSNFSP